MWTIKTVGTREGVIDQIRTAKVQPEGSDQSQLERVKSLLEAEINALPSEFNACRVDATGDDGKNGRTAQFMIMPMNLALRKG